MSLSRTASASSSRTATSSASSSTSPLSQMTDSDPVSERPASAFCKDNRLFREWTSEMQSVVIDINPMPKYGVLKAKELIAKADPTGPFPANTLGVLLSRPFLEGLFLLHNQKHYSEASFRTAIDCLFRCAFTNDTYEVVAEARTYIPGGSKVVPPLTADVDIVAIRRVIFPEMILEQKDLHSATLFHKFPVNYKEISIGMCFAEYKMNESDADQMRNQVVVDLLANARQLSYLGIWDVQVHAIALLYNQPIILYEAQISSTGSITMVSSAEPKDINPNTLEGFVSLYLLFCRIRVHAENGIVKKCKELTVEHLKTARQPKWRLPSFPPEDKKDEDGKEPRSDWKEDDDEEVSRKRGRASSSPAAISNKGGERNGAGEKATTRGYGDNTIIISPSPRHFLHKESTILAPGFLDSIT